MSTAMYEYTDSDSPPAPSRWQQLYSSDSTSTRINTTNVESEQSNELARMQNKLNEALEIEDEDRQLHKWIESIQSTEDTIARLKMGVGDDGDGDMFGTFVPSAEESVMQASPDAVAPEDFILEELEAMMYEHECDASFDLNCLESPQDPFVDLFRNETISNDDIDELDEGLILKALIHHQTRSQAWSFREWYKISVEEKLRRESLFEWFRATISHRYHERCFQAWIDYSRFSRSQLKSFQQRRNLHRAEKIFCAWFNIVKAELDEAKSTRIIIVQKKVFYQWKNCKDESALTLRNVMKTYNRCLVRKSLSALIIFATELKEVRIKEKQEELERNAKDRKYKAAAMIHDLNTCPGVLRRNNQGCWASKQNSSGEIDLTGSGCDKENHVNSSDPPQIVNKRNRTRLQRTFQARHSHNSTKIDWQYERDEKERTQYLQQKRDEKMKQIAKEKDFERLKEAWKLAKMHYALSLLKRCFLVYWVSYVQERRLKMLKAENVWRDRVLVACMDEFAKNVKYRKICALELESQKFSQVDEYHYCYVLKTTLKGWQEQSNYSHTVLYPRVQWLGMHHKKRRILDVWSSHLAYQKLRSLKWDRIAREKGVENHLKWAMRRWKEGATTLQTERLSEEEVLEKWKEVRGWLEDTS